MIPVTKAFIPPFEEYLEYLRKIWDSGWLTNNGQFEQELEKQLEAYLKLPHIELVANGTLALQLAIKALHLKGEIITTPFTYVASPNAIVWEGCEPVFVDIDERSLCIDPDLIESAITERTSAILATHVFGLPCDVERIEKIAEKHQLKVIYDAAHCFAVEFKGRSLMQYGDISTLSFHATKVFHTVEGGAVVCRDEETEKLVFLLKKFGHIGEEDYYEAGINAKMSELHAAMGLTNLPKVKEIIDERKMLTDLYDEELLIAGNGLSRPAMPASLDYNYAYYPLIFSEKSHMARTRHALMNAKIFPRRYFYPSLNTLPFLQPKKFQPCPVSESIAQRILCLPLYPGLSKQDVHQITAIIKDRLK